jgi:kumamolisin
MRLSKTFRRQPRFTLPGSEKQLLSQATRVSPPSGLSTPAVAAMIAAAPVGPQKPARGSVTVSVIVKRKEPLHLTKLGTKVSMTRTEFARHHGSDADSVALVAAFAKDYGLRSKKPSPGRRNVELTGTVTTMQEAFGVILKSTQIGDRVYRTRQGSISLPRALYGHVEAVLGLDNRPQAEPHFRISEPSETETRGVAHAAAATAAKGFSPPQVAELYRFPTGAKATGQTVGLIELEGGFRQSDLTEFFKSVNQPVPQVIVIPVSGGANSPTGDPTGPDGEVLLDIEVAGSVAPGATIAVYFAPNTDKGFANAIATAVHDTKNKPCVISISWGAAEARWTAQSMTAIDDICRSAAALGITIMVAAGDHGSSDNVADGNNHTDFPASSPHVLSCGGTKLIAKGTSIASETVWNEASGGATGGGVSNFFPLPDWQDKAGVPKSTVSTGGRGVPDVSGDADQTTGYDVVVDGRRLKIGGTSAVAPLWAGLIALSNAQAGSGRGFINPLLYSASPKRLFHDIVSGDNGAFKARKGWDPCTGLGSPIGLGITKELVGTTAKASSARQKRRR